MFRVRKQIGADAVTKLQLVKPVGIAVLDSGVSLHPDLQNHIAGFYDFVNERNSTYDDNGHGTHVCGIIAGDGKLSAGRYKGMAPEANLYVGKVLDHLGDGTVEHMLAGIRWVLEKQKEYNIRVLNISVGIGELKNKEKEQLLVEWLERAWDNGLAVVCAAGNGGPKADSLSPLGKSSKVITVGCHDGEYYRNYPGRCENYSARGREASWMRKPDIVAPGTEIVSCDFRCRKYLRGYRQAYVKKSGTSMATAIVSGALGLLFQVHGEYGNEHGKRKLLYSATDLGEAWNKQGYGMVNVAKLLE